MAKKTSVSVLPEGNPNLSSEGDIGPAQRERIIREAAYFRYIQRGSAPGYDLDDWLAAEAEFFSEESEQRLPESVDTTELDVQESGLHGFRQDDALKRIVRQHPQKGIPQIESIEPKEAPPKE